MDPVRVAQEQRCVNWCYKEEDLCDQRAINNEREDSSLLEWY
jgi:hypothetical protein